MKSTSVLPQRLPFELGGRLSGCWLPWRAAAEASPHFISKSLGQFENGGFTYSLPRYIYLGSKGGGDTTRIGIFAAIQGDEPEGALMR